MNKNFKNVNFLKRDLISVSESTKSKPVTLKNLMAFIESEIVVAKTKGRLLIIEHTKGKRSCLKNVEVVTTVDDFRSTICKDDKGKYILVNELNRFNFFEYGNYALRSESDSKIIALEYAKYANVIIY